MIGRMIGIAGRSGSGKIRLMVDLVRVLSGRGLRISAIIGTTDPADIDQAGKDSFRYRAAGAAEVMVTSLRRWALIHDAGAGKHDLPAPMTAVDLILVEHRDNSGVSGGYPMIEIHRAASAMGVAPLGPDDPAVVAVISEQPLDGFQKPVIDPADLSAVADFIVMHTGLGGTA